MPGPVPSIAGDGVVGRDAELERLAGLAPDAAAGAF